MTDNSNEECNREECQRVKAKLAEIIDWLEDTLEGADFGGQVTIDERVLDGKLNEWVR